MCKARPYGCPILNNTQTKPTMNWTIKESYASKVFTKKNKKIQKQSTTKVRTFSSPTKSFVTKSIKTFLTSHDPTKKVELGRSMTNFRQENTASSQSIVLYALLSLLILILLILLATAAIKIFTPCKRIQRQELMRSLSSSYTTNPLMPVPTHEGK